MASRSFLQDKMLLRDTVAELAGASEHRGPRHIWGLCPFHGEKTASFCVTDIGFYCFGCGAKGSHITYVIEKYGVDYEGAIGLLANRIGLPFERRGESNGGNTVPAPRENVHCDKGYEQRRDLHVLYQQTENLIQYQAASAQYLATITKGRQMMASLMPESHFQRMCEDLEYENTRWSYSDRFRSNPTKPNGDRPRPDLPELTRLARAIADTRPRMLEEYLRKRGISERIENQFQIGLVAHQVAHSDPLDGRWADRLAFPLLTHSGAILGFGGRTMNGCKPKYLNTKCDKSSALYGMDLASDLAYERKHLIVVEGYADVWALHGAGLEQSVAVMGTSFGNRQARMMRPFREVTFCFDQDEAGQQAQLRAFPVALLAGLWPSVMDLGEHKDPDEIIGREGREGFLHRFAARKPLFEAWVSQAKQRDIENLILHLDDPFTGMILAEVLYQRGMTWLPEPNKEPPNIGGLRLRQQGSAAQPSSFRRQ